MGPEAVASRGPGPRPRQRPLPAADLRSVSGSCRQQGRPLAAEGREEGKAAAVEPTHGLRREAPLCAPGPHGVRKRSCDRAAHPQPAPGTRLPRRTSAPAPRSSSRQARRPCVAERRCGAPVLSLSDPARPPLVNIGAVPNDPHDQVPRPRFLIPAARASDGQKNCGFFGLQGTPSLSIFEY